MKSLPSKLQRKLLLRKEQGSLRQLPFSDDSLIDFSSNDYLGLASNFELFDAVGQFLAGNYINSNGATGSRLISGNHPLHNEVEKMLANFHQVEAALLFNSGYDANLGFFASVPQRGDLVLYDEFSHASIRDGITLGNAKAQKFAHNNLNDLSVKLDKLKRTVPSDAEVYVVTESVFSMDGDSPDLEAMVHFCKKYDLRLVIDEAHALGVYGGNGAGLVQCLGLHEKVFARIMTFGKALGCHGAAILGSTELKQYLVNFARSFIYTTGMPPHSLATILIAYRFMSQPVGDILRLRNNIEFFKLEIKRLGADDRFIDSDSAVHCFLVGDIKKAKELSGAMKKLGFDIRAILSPTVPEGQERLRICLHSYNTEDQIKTMLENLVDLFKN
ncbi:8-amino-7-oxononanoate synthase [Euzebyella marina]|uniref:8-amino-7-oxononanoate synthase n=1 Tax=Euzebyella marina TaxID=1761453 RepID=A0A3G2LB22_9FLAO|nr:8-amino-7-oxononanoate synthase [Euzebyella marina]AYN69466.1 8-amino-7-oxononanoate synthase [Euzebyella marina]